MIKLFSISIKEYTLDFPQNNNKLIEISNEIIKLAKNTLLVNLRFMDLAIGQFNNSISPTSMIPSYATDGKHLLYNPENVLSSYKQEKENVPRDFLHVIMHCIFRHMFVSKSIQQKYWNLACDIAIENTITGLDIPQITTRKSQKQQQFIESLKQNVKYLTAECIYFYFIDNKPQYPDSKIDQLNTLFFADSHDYWYKKESLNSSLNNNSNDKDIISNSTSFLQNSENIENIENKWKQISQRVQIDMETFNNAQGSQKSSLLQNLQQVNREKYDYTSFLKKFATLNEEMKINDDEFDYIFYTYGLSLYKNVPLIEPLEYKDEKVIKEFVIAIDTSGSVKGEVVQSFIQKTYNILKSTESFSSKINLHIIQCDADIQEDKKITNSKEFDQYIKTMKLRGFGGTDFRPVFSYVYKLIKEKEFTNLKGLIYFTDGYGIFPKNKTPYTTAFVFVNNDRHYDNNYNIPSWAIKLILEPQDILESK